MKRSIVLGLLLVSHAAAAHPFPKQLAAVSTVGTTAYTVLDPAIASTPANPTRIALQQMDNFDPSAALLGPERKLDVAAPVTLLSATGTCEANAVATRPYGLESEVAATTWHTASRLEATACNPVRYTLALAGRVPELVLETEARREVDVLSKAAQAAIRKATRKDEYVLGVNELGTGRLHVTLNARGKTRGRTLVIDGARVVASFDGIASWVISSRGEVAFYGMKQATRPTELLRVVR